MRITTYRMAWRLGLAVVSFASVLACLTAWAVEIELRPVLAETNGVVTVEYRSGNTLVGRSSASAPTGVELLLPGAHAAPVEFRAKTRLWRDLAVLRRNAC